MRSAYCVRCGFHHTFWEHHFWYWLNAIMEALFY